MVFLGSTPIGGPILRAICGARCTCRAARLGHGGPGGGSMGATQVSAADAEADGSPPPLADVAGGLVGAD